jgi:hypothetical protein
VPSGFPVSQNSENQKPFVTGLAKESLCTIKLFFSIPNMKILSSSRVFTNSKFCYHDIVAMTHTQLSMV